MVTKLLETEQLLLNLENIIKPSEVHEFKSKKNHVTIIKPLGYKIQITNYKSHQIIYINKKAIKENSKIIFELFFNEDEEEFEKFYIWINKLTIDNV